MQKKKIIVGLSGGVDSAVTAYLLKQEGHEVIGVFMRNWDDDSNHCTNVTDEADAHQVCKKIGIEFQTVNFSRAYMDKVFSSMLNDLRRGYTPNPDILCNQEIKFNVLLDYALEQNADYLATGHYAQIKNFHGQPALASACDQNKDQTYFLCRLPQKALKHIQFPIGGLQKSAVRSIASEIPLNNANKKDSTGICFIGERKFSEFISEYLLDRPGDIINEQQQILGQHRGLFYYTIGQRKGLSIGGQKNCAEQPWFVLKKDIKKNTVIVGQGEKHPLLYRKILTAKDIHWLIDPKPVAKTLQVHARIRHRQSLQEAKVEIKENHMIVEFTNAQRAITPGQSIALYIENICIASAIIEESPDDN